MAARTEGANEDRYRTLFERAPLGIVYADANSVYLDANEAACLLLGYRREELIGLHASDIVVPSEVPAIASALEEIHGDREHHREWTFKRKDGSTFVAEVIATKFPDGTLLGMIRDVSELRRKTLEVRRADRLFSALSRVNQAIIYAPSREKLFDDICRALVEDGGLKMAWIGWLDIVTREVRPVASAGDTSGYLANIRVTDDAGPDGAGPTGAAVRTGQPQLSSDLLADPRSAPWHEALERSGFHSSAAFPILIAERPVGAISVYAEHKGAFRAKATGLLIEVANNLSFALENLARDEARIAVERTLGTEQHFSDTIIESMPGVVYLFDQECRFLRWNRNFEGVSGYTGEEIARMHPTDFFAPEERELIAGRIADAFAHGASSAEASLIARDGLRTPYVFTSRRIQFAGRHCVVGVGIDIAERRQLVEQLRQAHKMEAIGRLAGGVAHDFNNLLTVIGGYSEALLSEEVLSADARQSVVAIHEAGKRAGELTRQLLSFSRQAILEPRIIDANTHIEHTARLLQRLIGEDLELRTMLDPDCGMVRVDPGQFDQVLMNLAVNARDAMPRGGQLTLETRPVTLVESELTARLECAPGDYVMLVISDTGSGMSRAVLDRIFEPFFTTKELGRGTGLGLSMVFGIVKQSDGAIDVESTPGVGTCFRIYLPAVREPSSRHSDPASSASVHGDETILVVEDDEGVRLLTVKSLEMRGYTLLVARSGLEAIDLAAGHPGTIHLLLTDVVMPTMSGPVLAESLKAFRPTLKVLFMSGYTDDAVVRHGLLDATVDLIQKPFAPRALARKVRDILDRLRPEG